MFGREIIQHFQLGLEDERLASLYADPADVIAQRSRYIHAIQRFQDRFGEQDISIFSAPGRTEIGGNHTDHQRGEIIAAAITLDAIAVVSATDEPVVTILSEGYGEITVALDDLSIHTSEIGTTASLIRGILHQFQQEGYLIGGFQAYITSDVLGGSGLSSSATFEVLIGTILSGLYHDMRIDPITIARIAQYAENNYFGKPCGLMDQISCAYGNLVHVSFRDPSHPTVEELNLQMEAHGYALCITDTHGSHADLTAEYAAIPNEMRQVASYFGKADLLDVQIEEIYEHLTPLRTLAGDRAVLRALHFISENERVGREAEAIRNQDMEAFLTLVDASGNSSYKYLQNVYPSSDIAHQGLSLALRVSEDFLNQEGLGGVCRVHGGGFAGTIQAFVPTSLLDKYMTRMNALFGEHSCQVLGIRRFGGIRVIG